MRLRKPRIAPLQQSEWSDEQRKALQPFADRNQLFNIYTTLGHSADALQSFLAWGSYVLRRTSLPARERELVILRVGYLCKSGYEWAQHSRLGRQVGLTDSVISRLKSTAISSDWDEQDQALLKASDDLIANHFICDDIWADLHKYFNDLQCMDLVFIVGHYTQVCMMLNTFGIQLDEGLQGDEDLMSS